MQILPENKKIILFDGVCNLCNSAVQFVIKHDKMDVFRFVAIQSQRGQEILNHIGVESTKMDSIVLYEPGLAYYFKSDAILQIARHLNVFFSLVLLLKIVPKGLRDKWYDYIAKNRYTWYGKKESCMIPTPSLEKKFLK